MQVLVHVSVLEGIVGGFLGGVGRGVEVLELGGEAHADFEGVGHGMFVVRSGVFWSYSRLQVHTYVFGLECRVGEVKSTRMPTSSRVNWF